MGNELQGIRLIELVAKLDDQQHERVGDSVREGEHRNIMAVLQDLPEELVHCAPGTPHYPNSGWRWPGMDQEVPDEVAQVVIAVLRLVPEPHTEIERRVRPIRWVTTTALLGLVPVSHLLDETTAEWIQGLPEDARDTITDGVAYMACVNAELGPDTSSGLCGDMTRKVCSPEWAYQYLNDRLRGVPTHVLNRWTTRDQIPEDMRGPLEMLRGPLYMERVRTDRRIAGIALSETVGPQLARLLHVYGEHLDTASPNGMQSGTLADIIPEIPYLLAGHGSITKRWFSKLSSADADTLEDVRDAISYLLNTEETSDE